jgi:hypothetical protein
MTAPITLGTGEQPAATAVEPSPLAVCQWCHQPVGGPLDACDEPDCQYQDARLAALFRGQPERDAALATDPDIRAEDRAKRREDA